MASDNDRHVAKRKSEISREQRLKLQKTSQLGNQLNKGFQNGTVDDFRSITAFVVPAGIGKIRTELFNKQLRNLGAVCCNSFAGDKVTHVIVDETMDLDRLSRILKLSSFNELASIKIVKSLWLSACIKKKEHIDTSDYELLPHVALQSSECTAVDSKSPQKEFSPADGNLDLQKIDQLNKSNPQKHHPFWNKSLKEESEESDYMPSGDEETFDDLGKDDSSVSDAANARPRKNLPKGSWICAQSSRAPLNHLNHNAHITEKLEEMANTYQSMNEKWRVLGYQKAIMALKKHPKPITSFEEAKSLYGVGERLAEKIWEIAESGELRKLNELTSQEENQAMTLFANIWGAGAQTARAWVMQGFRTLDDLRARATLTRNQQIGLKYYDELMDRMPREEAAQIEAVVKEAALSIQPGLVAIACGSYRRDKATCGDVDVLITHPDGRSHANVYHPLLHQLHEIGFLTDDLVSMENEGPHCKYLGICRLPGDNSKHRRLDIIIVPYEEYACALMYFTGSAHFNRSLRHLAGRMNMSLNEHALSSGVIRSKGMKVNQGVRLHTPTEQSIFEHLGIPYRPPEERDH